MSKHALVPDRRDVVSVTVADQTFGVPVLDVRDVLGPQRISRIPLAPSAVAGSLNLRGRIVTAIDMRIRLRLPPRPEGKHPMSMVVDHGGELYGLLVDGVGEVLSLDVRDAEPNPLPLDPIWREVSAGIYRLTDTLLVALDVGKVLVLSPRASAA
jgi:purine-binding chemotaxis protein CheW